TIFTGLLTMHGIVATALDTTGTRAARFVVSSFVPVVGNALGEALHTINGCVKMLKSGVSAFGLLAGLFVFLPILIQCLVWLLTLQVCIGIGDIFELKEISSLLKASGDVIETLISIILCCMMILMVSTVILLIIGGGS
ncbi:MAG: stage III sporulation protein AE, partial [Ruminococcaceae bacterium]|nr:stage III sporulation protein AE [Oscillospiraceae bacterium]